MSCFNIFHYVTIHTLQVEASHHLDKGALNAFLTSCVLCQLLAGGRHKRTRPAIPSTTFAGSCSLDVDTGKLSKCCAPWVMDCGCSVFLSAGCLNNKCVPCILQQFQAPITLPVEWSGSTCLARSLFLVVVRTSVCVQICARTSVCACVCVYIALCHSPPGRPEICTTLQAPRKMVTHPRFWPVIFLKVRQCSTACSLACV